MRFNVTFGPDSLDVEAANAEDAWSAFCATFQAALRHPNQYVRVIQVVSTGVVASTEEEPEEPEGSVEPEEPVCAGDSGEAVEPDVSVELVASTG